MTSLPGGVDSGRPQTPSTPTSQLPAVSITHLSLETSSPVNRKSPWKHSNRSSIQEQQRRTFVYHLTKWSLNHDSSPHFHGNISLAPQPALGEEILEFGKSVRCILTDKAFSDARTIIVVRLFPPKRSSRQMGKILQRHRREDSMDPLGTGIIDVEQRGEDQDPWKCQACPEVTESEHGSGITQRYYKLVIRCGAGWMSARDYFNKLHFSNSQARKVCLRTYPRGRTLDHALAERSKNLGPPSDSKDTVKIQPLFHPFTRLPPELQELILFTATGLFGSYNMCHDSQLLGRPITSDTEYSNQRAISLSTLLRISPHINETLVPYIYHATDFHFGLTGFTNFLWQSSHRRCELRRLTFHFGKLALLHCIRWLAPDHIFELFEPPVVTEPRSLQYFWRCQIQDLAREVRLLTLTLDIRGIPLQDLPMVTRIMRESFGGVDRINFVETDQLGNVTVIEHSDVRLAQLGEGKTWRELSHSFFEKYRRFQYFTKFSLLNEDMERLEELMNEDQEAFDR